MCNESQKTKETKTSTLPSGKVSHGSVPVPPFTTPHRGAKSLLTKLKKFVKNVMMIHGSERGGRKSNLRRTSEDETVVETERNDDDDDGVENTANEDKLNIVNRKLKMAYTIEELKGIVDDNLANELREIRARENH